MDYKNLWGKIRSCKNSNKPWRCVQLDKLLLKTDCHKYFKFSSVLKNQVNLCYQGRMTWLCQALPLNSKMGSVNNRTFSRVTIKRVYIQVMMGIKDERLMFCFFLKDNKLSHNNFWTIRCQSHPQQWTAL